MKYSEYLDGGSIPPEASKKCNCCGLIKSSSDFYKSDRGKLGLQSYCKLCYRKRSDNRPILVYVRKLKESTPCADCGEKYHFSVMDFDHVRGVKLFCVTQGVIKKIYTDNQVLEEIHKCEIVCANCHRYRTWKRHYTTGC